MEGKIITIEEYNELLLTVQQLTERVSALENENQGSGVYLNGSPKYVRDFLDKKRELDDAQRRQNGGK